MIGVFDSGLGGVQSLQYLKTLLPTYDFLYLGDTQYVPYGEKPGERIHDRTFQCLERLFDQGCSLVILACNTASAYALRDRQIRYPERKVLSVTVPGVEALVQGGFHKPLLLGTKVTLETHIYESVRERAFPDYSVTWYVQIGTGRVDALEEGQSAEQLQSMVDSCHLERFHGTIDSIVLGCTHYPLIREQVENVLHGIPIIDPAAESAQQLIDYLKRHDEIDVTLSKNGSIDYYVTGDEKRFDALVRTMFHLTVLSQPLSLNFT